MDTYAWHVRYVYGIGMCMYVLYVCHMSHRDMDCYSDSDS